jgi:hypothetical protein
MALFHRRDQPPADVVADLPKDERVVSWADTESGSVVLATPAGLWWPDAEAHRLVGWQYVNKATWHEDVLTVIEAEVLDDVLLVDRPALSARLTVPRDLPPTVRKRVEGNVVNSEVQPIAGGTARFVTRRVPGSDGVVWWARLEPGTRDTPYVRTALADRVTQLRAEWERARADA